MRIRSNFSVCSVLLRIYQNLIPFNQSHIFEKPLTAAAFNFSKPSLSDSLSAQPKFGFSILSFSSSATISNSQVSTKTPKLGFNVSGDNGGDDDDDDDDDDEEEEDEDDNDKYNDKDDAHFSQLDTRDDNFSQDVKAILNIIHEVRSKAPEIKDKLEHCGITASPELVVEVLSRIRNDWEAAFTFFLWAGKQRGYAHSIREYHSMISILGKMRKFDTAWTLIEEMKRGNNGSSLVTPQTLLIMIRKYCAVHDVGRAISTFYAYKRFNFQVGLEEFQSLLSALCRYKNVQDAEHLLFCNRNVFPFDTKSFNIILNGWGNVIGSTSHAERIWQEMDKRGIKYDVVSYSSLLSCYSKSSKLYKVLNLFDQMKKMKITPDSKVYNAVIHALAKGKLVNEAVNLMKTMEDDIAPNIVTYNSLIKPLCKARKIDEAKKFLDEMLQRGLSPTIQTYHAFFRILRTKEEVFTLLGKMRKQGCDPTIETYIMLIRKFCRWRQLDAVFDVWSQMKMGEVNPDRSAYIVLIHGLFLNGKLEEAHKYYIEMQERGFLPEPKTEEMLQAWVSGRQAREGQVRNLEVNGLENYPSEKRVKAMPRKFDRDRDFLRQPETRRVVRERGFSFWEQ